MNLPKHKEVYTPRNGEQIDETCRNVIEKAKAANADMVFFFNGIGMVATPKMEPESLERQYREQIEEMRSRYEQRKHTHGR